MVAAAFSTGVEEQVEAFIRLARVAEQFDLPDDLRRGLAVKAYRSYAESLPFAPPLRPEFRNVVISDIE